jgi:hypothetical protein
MALNNCPYSPVEHRQGLTGSSCLSPCLSARKSILNPLLGPQLLNTCFGFLNLCLASSSLCLVTMGAYNAKLYCTLGSEMQVAYNGLCSMGCAACIVRHWILLLGGHYMDWSHIGPRSINWYPTGERSVTRLIYVSRLGSCLERQTCVQGWHDRLTRRRDARLWQPSWWWQHDLRFLLHMPASCAPSRTPNKPEREIERERERESVCFTLEPAT